MGWEYAYRRCQTGKNADVYRVPQESLLMIWRNQLRTISLDRSTGRVHLRILKYEKSSNSMLFDCDTNCIVLLKFELYNHLNRLNLSVNFLKSQNKTEKTFEMAFIRQY